MEALIRRLFRRPKKIEVDLPEETVMQLVALGYAREKKNGVYEMTPEGERWFRCYLEAL